MVPGNNWPSPDDDWDFISNSDLIKRVHIGEMKVKKQYDAFIGLHNSGASEMRVIRVDGYLQTLNNGDIVDAGDNIENLTSKSYKRRWIRKKKWKGWYTFWDSNWESDNKEQQFVIYEEDNNVTQSLSLTISTVFTVGGLPITASGDYTTTIPTEDDLIRTWRMDGETFFRTNTSDQGCGFRNYPIYEGKDFPIYDCGTDVEYTLPHVYFN